MLGLVILTAPQKNFDERLHFDLHYFLIGHPIWVFDLELLLIRVVDDIELFAEHERDHYDPQSFLGFSNELLLFFAR